MKKYNAFETTYKNSRQYALGKLAGSLIADQQCFDKNSVEFRRLAYQTFKQESQTQFKMSIDRNAWAFDQNELKTAHNGKESLKSLCEGYFVEAEALFLANEY